MSVRIYEPHELAGNWPLLYGAALDRLRDDIRDHGQREPIVLLGGRILDGRNRLAACKLAGATPKFRAFGDRPDDGKDPRALVASLNGQRRDLNQTQRAMVAARMANRPEGQPKNSANLQSTDQERAGQIMGVSTRSVASARSVWSSGCPALIDACLHDGEPKISKAERIAKRPESELIQIDQLARRSPKPTFFGRLFDALENLDVVDETNDPERTNGRGKPDWLMRALVRDYSLRENLICDPFAGYGSTLEAARMLRRRAIGAEIDVRVAEAAADADIRVGRWQDVLHDVGDIDTIICDPPYSEVTHAAGTTRNDGVDAGGLTPNYEAWSPEHVHEFVRAWSPRCRGWMVALTDDELMPHFKAAYREAGRFPFAVSIVIRGMTVRINGDGPSSWTIHAIVARPSTREFMASPACRTLPGAYVGTKSRALDRWFDEDEDAVAGAPA